MGVRVKNIRVNEVIPAETAVFVRDNREFVLTEYVLTRVYCIMKVYYFEFVLAKNQNVKMLNVL